MFSLHEGQGRSREGPKNEGYQGYSHTQTWIAEEQEKRTLFIKILRMFLLLFSQHRSRGLRSHDEDSR